MSDGRSLVYQPDPPPPDTVTPFPSSGRTVPSNLAAEQALLGAIMSTPKAFLAVEEFLQPRHFADPIHSVVYEALAKRLRAGQVADLITLKAEFEGAGILQEVGGMAYLAQLQAAMVTPLTAGEYGRVVREAWLRRQMIAAGQALVERAYGEGADPGAVLRDLQADVDRLSSEGIGQIGRGRPVSLRDAMDQALAAADRAAAGNGVVGVSTGMASVDAVLGGLEPATLNVLAGRPGSGKSSLGHQWAIAAARSGVSVAEFSLEMSAAALGRRALSVASGVPISRMRRGEHAKDITALLRARKEMAELPLSIHDGGRFTPSDILTKCRTLMRTKGLGLILVDHLHLVPAEGGAAKFGPTAGVTEVVDAILGIAKQCNVPVLLLAQLNRATEGREDHRPTIADLRQSGAIEQNADTVSFVYREEQYLSRAERPKAENETEERYQASLRHQFNARQVAAGKAELLCEKVRDGEPATVHLHFDGPTASFSEAVA